MVTVSEERNSREYICCFPEGSPGLPNITFIEKRACCVCNSCFRHLDFNDVAPLYRDEWYQAQLHGLGAERTAVPSLRVPEVHAIAYAYKRVLENTRELRILDIGRLIFSAKKEGEMPFDSANRNASLSAATAFNPATRDCTCELKPSYYGSEEPSTEKIVTKLSMNRIKELRRIPGCNHVFSPPEMGGERELLQGIRDADSGSSDDETMTREDKSPHSLLMRTRERTLYEIPVERLA